MFGGSTTSILINTPGAAATFVTSVDGHALARAARRARRCARRRKPR
ncbi:hypothetical protein DPM13_12695 [Paracoccus mutanolyticus]|uniref:DUF112 domain-containing protein n=1 Tax=Paracoccus mutanolyticus TaxID=1499308 RepID=A0ABM6WSQ1_9RHOB|nr:tripartite tricarboxylate transporter permease [Paracoccus mutanolyticus]AWX93645.1 hypothetical protein DPM13_12695 [Paracoccus mutanolyticus]